MDDITLREADKLEALEVDTTELRKKLSDVKTIEARLKQTKQSMMDLDVKGKTYDQDLARLSAVYIATEGQLAAANRELAECITALKKQATQGVPRLNDLQVTARHMDRDIVNHMRQIYDIVVERHNLALEMIDISEMVRQWANETSNGNPPPGYPNGAFPGHPVWGHFHPREAFMSYVKRFYVMAGAGLPDDNADPFNWFSRRRF